MFDYLVIYGKIIFTGLFQDVGVVSGLPGALYSICCFGVSTILESIKIVTM